MRDAAAELRLRRDVRGFVHARRVLFASLLAACTPVEPERAPSPKPVASPPAHARALELAPPAKPHSAFADPDRIGIGPCDAYRERFGRCIVEHVPSSVEAPFREALDATWRAWTDAAIGPAVVALPAACRAALDAARMATQSLGCEWPAAPHAYGPIGIDECDGYVRDYGECIATRVPARRRAAMLAGLVEQVTAWQDAHIPPNRGEPRPACTEARAAARTATARYRCKL